MENQETIIQVHSIEHKVGKESGRPFQVIETSQGQMTCHEKSILDNLEKAKAENKLAVVVAVQSGQYNNLRKFLRFEEGTAAETAAANPTIKPEVVKPDKFLEAREVKNVSMYTSYAKDIYCAMIANPTGDLDPKAGEGLMDWCVARVKQAKESFEQA